jgi:HK97 family phage portal protein
VGFINKIFGKKKKKSSDYNPYQGQTGYTGWWFKDIKSKKDSDVIQAAIHCIALHASKMRFTHVHNKKKKSDLQRLLEGFPNPYMPMQQFLYKWISLCLYNDNAFVYPEYDYVQSKYVALHILQPSTYELLEAKKDGSLWIKFIYSQGKEAIVPYDKVLHLRNYFVDHDILGGLNNTEKYLENVSSYDASRKSIAEATLTSSRVIGKLMLNDSISDADKEKAIAKFNEFLKKTENQSAVYPEDMNSTLIPIDLKPKSAAGQQLDKLKTDILQYLPINEAILSGKYTEQDIRAFYDTAIEPFAIQITQISTRGLLSEDDRKNGEHVQLKSDMLDYSSVDTKLNVVKVLAPIKGIKIGDIRQLFGFEFGDDGDDYVQSLNYVKGSKADEYQGVGDKKEKEKEDKENEN